MLLLKVQDWAPFLFYKEVIMLHEEQDKLIDQFPDDFQEFVEAILDIWEQSRKDRDA